MKKSTNSSPTTVPTFGARLLAGIKRDWQFFTSLRFAIFTLCLIGVASIYGTMNFASNASLGDNAIPMARTQFFEAPWFIALIVLFAVQLVFSTWHVTKMSVGIFWKRDFQRDPDYYKYGKTPRATVVVPDGINRVEGVFKRRFSRSHRDGNALFAHIGLLSRMGPTIIHLGIIIVITSMTVKSVLLWSGSIVTEGRFIAAEGESSHLLYEPIDTAQQITDQNLRARSLGLWIKVLDFDEIRHPNSSVPAHFRSLVEVRNPDTQEIIVAQLDMNHVLKLDTAIGHLKFHQAGYQAVEDGEFQRINFDVRRRDTGERIAVTDTHARNRVRIGETEYFLEVDDIKPASRWRVYTNESPWEPVAQGLVEGNRELDYSYRVERFFPAFVIDPETRQPTNRSNELMNPALEITTLLNGRDVDSTWLFFDRELASAMPDQHPRFRLNFRDIRLPRSADRSAIDWSRPGAVMFEIALEDREKGETIRTDLLGVSMTSEPYRYEALIDHAPGLLGTEGNFEVRIMGPTQRYMTILSVVAEPTVPFVNLGVVLMLIGAAMTFSVRYRAIYGLWDEQKKELRLALVPRWGQSPVQEELDAIVAELGGKPSASAPSKESSPSTKQQLAGVS